MARSEETRRSPGIVGPAIRLFTILTASSAVLFGLAIYKLDLVLEKLNPLPDIKTAFPFQEQSWTNAGIPDDVAIVPWKLTVPDSQLGDLKQRLQKTRYGTPLQGVNFEYGFPGDQLRTVVDFWLTKYDWKKQESLINKYNQFKTAIEGLNIHFVHVRPTKPDNAKQTLRVVPIILLHGWPGSFFELYKLIPLLTTPQQIGNDLVVFEVIIPSLPGYGFSDASQKPGLDPAHMARIFYKLMKRLKFDKFFVHGGDWGSLVARNLATMYPKHVSGLEVTMYSVPMGASFLKSAIAWFTPAWICETAEPHKLFFNTFWGLVRESGYFHIQATKPDTVGAALLNDPAGLAAYILEKFSTWTDVANIRKPDGGLTDFFTLDDLLTNVMIYWTSGTIITSQRLYKEAFTGGGRGNEGFPVTVPTVLSDFPGELLNPADAFVRPYFKDLITISKHKTGGHFPSMERPDDVAGDIWTLVKTVLLRV